ncbi:MAG TPA: acyltransferase [Rhizomicrobium sp.]|nr:acyltransferase [Rhizomicrobium sp.]
MRNFDVLRGVSSIAVLLTHLHTFFIARLFGLQTPGAAISGLNGRIAVIVFLLLSGHLIAQSVKSNIDRNGHFVFSEYAVARIARIYPPLIGAITLCVVVGAIIFILDLPGGQTPYGRPGDLYRVTDHFRLSGHDILTSLLMLGGLTDADGPLWTLYVEFQMYIAAIGVAIWCGKRPRFRPFLLLMSASAFALALLHPVFAVIWIIGALTTLVPLNRETTVPLALAFCCIIAAGTVYNPALLTSVDMQHAGVMQVMIGAMLSCAIFSLWPKLEYPGWLIATGNFSYSLYVIHWPLLLLILSFTQEWIGRSLVRTTLIVGFAGPAVVLTSVVFASIFERQTVYRVWLTQLCSKILGVTR